MQWTQALKIKERQNASKTFFGCFSPATSGNTNNKESQISNKKLWTWGTFFITSVHYVVYHTSLLDMFDTHLNQSSHLLIHHGDLPIFVSTLLFSLSLLSYLDPWPWSNTLNSWLNLLNYWLHLHHQVFPKLDHSGNVVKNCIRF